jgi:hypothetical protein
MVLMSHGTKVVTVLGSHKAKPVFELKCLSDKFDRELWLFSTKIIRKDVCPNKTD